MNTDDFKQSQHELGILALKTIAFFFIGVPVILGIAVWALMS